MRIMAIDYGDVRTGIAVSDPTASIAGDAWVIEERSANKLAERIAVEARSRGAEKIILGYPKNMDGSIGPRAVKSETLAKRLRAAGLDVVLWDERRTTFEAHGILSDNNRYGKKRKETIDAVAATLILEGYLQSGKI